MLIDIHHAIQKVLYERGQIDPREVEITFNTPTRERIDRLLSPTINLFLFDVRENIELRQSHFQTTVSNGRAERRPFPRRFDFHYMLTVFASEPDDEYQLLWRVLSTLIQYPTLPDEWLPEEFRALEVPIATRVDPEDQQQHLVDIWSGLGVPPHPWLDYVLTLPLQMNVADFAPLVLSRTARYIHKEARQDNAEVYRQIGGTIQDQQGQPLAGIRVALADDLLNASTTDDQGRFSLRRILPGRHQIVLARQDGTQITTKITIPESSSQTQATFHEIILDISLGEV